MILSRPEVDRFYDIWWALLRHTNAKLGLLAGWPKQPAEGSLPLPELARVRDALWKDDSLREAFLAENPAALPAADLDIVAGWRHRVAGNFFVLRHLKNHSLFLQDGRPARAYGVVGLISPFAELLGGGLPVHVRAVLLPFGNKIIYDSLLAPSNVTFGSGIRQGLALAYRDALERDGLITSLPVRLRPPTGEEARKQVGSRNARLLSAFRRHLHRSGLGPGTVAQHVSNVATFAGTYLLEFDPPRFLLDLASGDLEAYLARMTRRFEEQRSAATSFRRFVRFLYESERLDPDAAWDLQDFLKRFRR